MDSTIHFSESSESCVGDNSVSYVCDDFNIDKEYIPGLDKSTAFIGHVCECKGSNVHWR